MLNFASDYTEGCHSDVLKALIETNAEQLTGYGSDKYTLSAIEKIRKTIKKPCADIFFVGGGTQTNQLIIDSLLKSYEGLIAAVTGHVAVHEAGAIEFGGHKVLTVPSHCGKVKADEVRAYLERFYKDPDFSHMVFPGMVYISHPTEYGTLYTKSELSALSSLCREYDIELFIDGARLGYGIMSRSTDVTIEDIASLSDVFYIGGTKVGALCGEAIVFPSGNAPKHFHTVIKQHGALFAKGRLCGVQFDALFTDDLYFKISENAIKRADELKAVMQKLGYPFFIDSPTNQQFLIFPNEKLKLLEGKVVFSLWEPYDDTHSVVRFCTSWATSAKQIDELFSILSSVD